MDLVRWLFGSKPRPDYGRKPSAIPAKAPSRPSYEFLDLPSHRFSGQCVVSPNGRFKLAWCNAKAVITLAGEHTYAARGRYLLLQGNKVLVEGKLPRPDMGRVADNGTFILNDRGSQIGLHGKLCAFYANGEQCLSVKFNAIPFSVGLSADGHLAACHTCNSDTVEDGAVLTIFDLIGKREISRSQPPSGWPDFYEFAPDHSSIGLGYTQLGVFRYQLTGEFTDREAWVDASLTKGDYGQVIMMGNSLVQDAVRGQDTELLSKILISIDRIMPSVHDDKWRALALKLRGIALDAQGSGAPALECFKAALSLDPKIGVKRQIARLRKAHPAARA